MGEKEKKRRREREREGGRERECLANYNLHNKMVAAAER